MTISTSSKTDLVEDNASVKSNETSSTPEPKSDWVSLWIAFIILFVLGVQFSVYFSSMYPYLQKIEPDAIDMYGWILACYSIGQMVSSPLLGYWTNTYKTMKVPIMVSMLVNILGNVLYVLTGSLDNNRQWVLMVARFITGLGAGSLSILRAYVAEASTAADRPRALTIAPAAQSVGIAIGPGLQAVFGSVGYPGTQVGIASFNMYTCPGYFVIGLGIVLEIALFFFFHESFVGVYNANKAVDPYAVLPKLDWLAALVMIWCWFALMFSYVIGETVGTPLTMTMFNWTTDDAVINNGWIFSGAAVLTFFMYIGMTYFAKHRISPRLSILVGLALMVCYYIVSFSWPGLPDIQTFSNETTLLPNISTTTISAQATTEATGCSTYDWCSYTTRITFAQYILAMVVNSIGYPICNVFVTILYAGIIGPRRSGKMQGALIVSGSAARSFGPIFISYMFSLYGPRVTWIIVAGVLLFTIALICVTYRRMVPLKLEYKGGENFRYKKGILFKF